MNKKNITNFIKKNKAYKKELVFITIDNKKIIDISEKRKKKKVTPDILKTAIIRLQNKNANLKLIHTHTKVLTTWIGAKFGIIKTGEAISIQDVLFMIGSKQEQGLSKFSIIIKPNKKGDFKGRIEISLKNIKIKKYIKGLIDSNLHEKIITSFNHYYKEKMISKNYTKEKAIGSLSYRILHDFCIEILHFDIQYIGENGNQYDLNRMMFSKGK
jgi:hypothetical protein